MRNFALRNSHCESEIPCEISHFSHFREMRKMRNFAISPKFRRKCEISHCEILRNFAKFYNHVAYQMKALEKCYKNMTKKLVFDLRGHRGDLKWPQKVNITQGGTATVLNFDTRNAIFFKWSNIVYMYVSLSQLQSRNFIFSKPRLESMISVLLLMFRLIGLSNVSFNVWGEKFYRKMIWFVSCGTLMNGHLGKSSGI